MNSELKKQKAKEYYQTNKERILKRAEEYRNNNKEQIKERNREYNIRNNEKILLKKAEYRQNNKEKIKETDKKYRVENPDKIKTRYEKRKRRGPLAVILSSLKARAKRKGFECTIESSDFEMITHCPVLGIELNYFNTKQSDNSPSFDRIDNSKGYIKGNVRIISWRANNLKSNGTIEEFEKIIQYIKGLI